MTYDISKKAFEYYIWASFRRKTLDKLQEKYKYLYRGIVLDIGGRDRGNFKKPKENVKKWIFADIEPKHNPDLVLDVSKMNNIENKSIDTIGVLELFEHVYNIEKGLSECHRALKEDGRIVLSVPFLSQIHGDPSDFQRWTDEKWRRELTKKGFEIEEFIIMGRFFTVLGDMYKVLIKTFPRGIKHISYLTLPFIESLVLLDRFDFVKRSVLGKFHGGYFIIAKK